MGFTIESKGNYEKLSAYLHKLSSMDAMAILSKYGEKGVEALRSQTPVDSGKTASSWSYTVSQRGETYSVNFSNSNVNDGVNIAIILQTGHGTGTGGWVAGRDYLNPALQPVFDGFAQELWKEVTSL